MSNTTPSTTVSRASGYQGAGRKLSWTRQLGTQVLLLFIALTVLFPILWIISLSLDPRGVSRPKELNIIPPGASLDWYQKVIKQPSSNPVSFPELAFNSFKLAGGSSLVSVLIGLLAAYSFSRFRFAGRQTLMLGVITVLMLPSIATLAPLYVVLNKIPVPGFFMTAGSSCTPYTLRNSLWGVGLAMVSGGLPFAIWNLKGYIDTIPKELEEAALIDGCNPTQTFALVMMPLAVPAIAVTAFVGFMGGSTEFALSWQFLTCAKDFTLTMALWNMTGQYADSVPWGMFAAMSILIALPVSLVYLALQRYIVGGLTVGGVKG
jgi:arabinogalactan oligomer/maltooligosaccharide transport system permease protein